MYFTKLGRAWNGGQVDWEYIGQHPYLALVHLGPYSRQLDKVYRRGMEGLAKASTTVFYLLLESAAARDLTAQLAAMGRWLPELDVRRPFVATLRTEHLQVGSRFIQVRIRYLDDLVEEIERGRERSAADTEDETAVEAAIRVSLDGVRAEFEKPKSSAGDSVDAARGIVVAVIKALLGVVK